QKKLYSHYIKLLDVIDDFQIVWGYDKVIELLNVAKKSAKKRKKHVIKGLLEKWGTVGGIRMKNLIITMTDSNYFQYGSKLLETRHVVDGDFICYGPDLSYPQTEVLRVHDIEYRRVDQKLWDDEMQSLKFRFIKDNTKPYCGGGITFVDWDTYFLKDWGEVFENNFSLGFYMNGGYREEGIYRRAWANGGVIFGHRFLETMNLCEQALNCIELGGLPELPEYDTIWKTLEEGRRP
ncbi:unnamed protein product, partial [marine sediment metagenome]